MSTDTGTPGRGIDRPPTDHRAIYRGVRDRVTALVRSLPDPDTALAVPAPATPGWRAHDVLAHLTGGTADIVAGNLDGVASDAWTQAQVDARLDTPVADLLDEWDRCCVTVEPLIADIPGVMRTMLLVDAVTHEHDIRGALGDTGARDTDAVAYAFGSLCRGIGSQRDAAGVGALLIVHEAGEVVTGTGGPSATVHVDRFELVRAAVGRRADEQIAAWVWEGAAHPATVVLERFAPPRAEPLVE